jgi:hypothetical protein
VQPSARRRRKRSSDHGIISAQATQSGLSLQLSALESDVFAWHGRCSSDAVAIGAISRSLARGYARDQRRPRSKQSLGLQSGRGTGIFAHPRRISLVLHIGREALDKLARTTRDAHRSRSGQAVRRYRTAVRILKPNRALAMSSAGCTFAQHWDSKRRDKVCFTPDNGHQRPGTLGPLRAKS